MPQEIIDSEGAFIWSKEKHLKKGRTYSKLRNAFKNSILILSSKCK
jgi:hypothetical protein